MIKKRYLANILLLSYMLIPAIANAGEANGYLQTVQIINFLSNTALTNQGMTPTAVTIKFFNDTSGKACWTTTLAYQADFTLHSGLGQNCPTAITSLSVTPILVSNVLQTYSGPYTINLDMTKYAYQINIVQDVAPVFESTNGLVKTPGTITAQLQMQVKQ